MEFETFDAYDFTFRNMDQDGVMCRYDALFSFSLGSGGATYLAYADAAPGDDGQEGLYVSLLVQPEQAAKAQRSVESGATPKKPPVIDLLDIDDPDERAQAVSALEAVLAEED